MLKSGFITCTEALTEWVSDPSELFPVTVTLYWPAAVADEIVMVMVVEGAWLYLTAREATAKLAVTEVLFVETDKFTVPLYLVMEYSFTVDVWVVPARMAVKLDGEADMLKFGVDAAVGVVACADADLTFG